MYLKLSVAGHLTIFLTRTRGPFWSIRPAKVLLFAVLGTQLVATLIAVYGLFMTPIGWRWAAFVWGYAIACFLVTDPLKLLAYRILDSVKDGHTGGIKAETQSETDTKPQPDATGSPQPEAKAALQTEAKGTAHPEAKATPEPEAKATPQPAAGATPRPEAKAAPQPVAKGTAHPEAEATPQPEGNVTSGPEGKGETPSDPTQQLVKRVHQLYEELGREDVQAVQDWDAAERKLQKEKPQE